MKGHAALPGIVDGDQTETVAVLDMNEACMAEGNGGALPLPGLSGASAGTGRCHQKEHQEINAPLSFH